MRSSTPASPAAAARSLALMRWLLPVSVFVSGAIVMVLEVLGTRVIGPVYGSSLYVWSALIAVALVSLSAGYWIGGALADRRPSPGFFFLIFEAAALLIALVPALRRPVFELTHGMDLRAGALACALLFLAAPLTLLGMVSPFAVRLATRELGAVGATAGRLYAISTAGSLVGTLLAGFWLIATFKVRTVLFGAAAALLVPALLYQIVAARRGLALGALAALAIAAGALRSESTSARVLHVKDSFFGQIKVAEGPSFRVMLLNGAAQTALIRGTRLSHTGYPYVMAEQAWRARPEGRRALIVGLGGGVLPQLVAGWGVSSHVVEIDSLVVRTARDWFGFSSEDAGVTIADGRQFLAATGERWDYILLDAFAGEQVPVHMLTAEMMRVVESRLAPGGVMVLNYVGFRSGARARPLRSILRTIETALPWTRVVSCGAAGAYGGNVIVAGRAAPAAAPDGPPPFEIPSLLDAEMAEVRAFTPDGPWMLLTDEHNPLDVWALDAHEAWRRHALETIPWDVMLAD